MTMDERIPLLCRLWGHAWNPEGAQYYCVYHCERCGHDGYTDGSWREQLSVKAWIFRRWFVDQMRGYRQWVHCEECHLWFGRHDDSFDHLPF